MSSIEACYSVNQDYTDTIVDDSADGHRRLLVAMLERAVRDLASNIDRRTQCESIAWFEGRIPDVRDELKYGCISFATVKEHVHFNNTMKQAIDERIREIKKSEWRRQGEEKNKQSPEGCACGESRCKLVYSTRLPKCA